MNKFTIPTILVATIMVAGIFAFVPVEQATSAHLEGITIIGAIVDGTIVDDDVNAGAAIVDSKLATITTDAKVSVAALDDTAGLVDIDFITGTAGDCTAICSVATSIDIISGDKAICHAEDPDAPDTVVTIIAFDFGNDEIDVTTAANTNGDTIIECIVLDLT